MPAVRLLDLDPAAVGSSRESLADPGWPVAEADVAVGADGVCELREPAVLPRRYERGPRVWVGRWCFSELVEVAAEEPAPVVGAEMGLLSSGSVVGIGSQSVSGRGRRCAVGRTLRYSRNFGAVAGVFR